MFAKNRYSSIYLLVLHNPALPCQRKLVSSEFLLTEGTRGRFLFTEKNGNFLVRTSGI